MRELFVYYRVADRVAAPARAAVLAMQAQLRQAHPLLIARLLCREAASGAEVADPTWMETYAIDPRHVGASVDLQLQAAIEAAAQALGPGLIGVRHTEVFVACAS